MLFHSFFHPSILLIYSFHFVWRSINVIFRIHTHTPCAHATQTLQYIDIGSYKHLNVFNSLSLSDSLAPSLAPNKNILNELRIK